MNTSATPRFTVSPAGLLVAAPDDPCVDQLRRTPNVGRALAPSLIVIHYTAGESALDAARWLCDRRARASAHLVVDRGGLVYQLAPFSVQTWHAGQSVWRGKRRCNSYAVGIELANLGWVYRGKDSPAERFVYAVHRHGGTMHPWERYPAAQVAATAAICAALIARYPAITEIVGHDDIAPGRKSDPGPAWDWPSFRGAVAAICPEFRQP